MSQIIHFNNFNKIIIYFNLQHFLKFYIYICLQEERKIL